MRLDRLPKIAILSMLAAVVLGVGACDTATQERAEVPITTSSDEARELYLEGRDLAENLRLADAREFYVKATEKDPDFALAHLGLATSAPTAKDFFTSMGKAVVLAGNVSEAERQMILGFDAGVKNDPAGQFEKYHLLVESHPGDKRAHNLLGAYYFGRQEYEKAIAEYDRALEIDPAFSPPYNQKGYAHRSLEQWADAEAAFQKYVELIPNEPNPYDSYAELLMKMGRFEESIENYEQALSRDPDFVASYIGIGLNRMFMGQTDEARETLRELYDKARNDGERRQALTWIAASYLHDSDPDRALEQIKAMYGIAEQAGDGASMAQDLAFAGTILLESGKPDKALEKYRKAVETMEGADVPDEVREGMRRNLLYNEARVALASDDLDTARAKAAEYRDAVATHHVPFEMRQSHRLAARVAIEDGDYDTALAELDQAGTQNPRVFYLQALAYDGKGDAEAASAAYERAAEFNGLNFAYSYVRNRARRMLEGS